MVLLLSLALLGYLIGSIPFGYLIPKWLNQIDIRTVGSKNVGATNVYRMLGLKWAIVVFLLDALKGAVYTILLITLGWLTPVGPKHLLLITPFIGHCFPLFLNFKGGRGVATGAGIASLIAPMPLVAALVTYLVAVKLTGHSFVGSLSGLLMFLGLDLFWWHGFWWPVLILIALAILVKHRTHIQSLIR